MILRGVGSVIRALGTRYHNGFAAAKPDDLERAEWPPHPGRVFMALAAALAVKAETAADAKIKKAAKKRLKEDYGNQPPPQRRPTLSLYQGYARAAETSDQPQAPGTVFSPHFIPLRLEAENSRHRALDLAGTLAVAARWREAILSHCNGESETVRSLLSGHEDNGAPLNDPHLAFVPLPFIGHEHAGGHLLGMGLVLPASMDRHVRRDALRVIGQVRRLKLGRLGVWKVVPVTESRPPWNLRSEPWTAHPEGATHWSTVTPIALDRHPKAKDKAAHQRELAKMIAKGCQRIGLPEPSEVIITQVSAHLGAPPAHVFPKVQRKDGRARRHTHAIVVFDKAVRGPVLIGAGRFRGYGLCRAMGAEKEKVQ